MPSATKLHSTVMPVMKGKSSYNYNNRTVFVLPSRAAVLPESPAHYLFIGFVNCVLVGHVRYEIPPNHALYSRDMVFGRWVAEPFLNDTSENTHTFSMTSGGSGHTCN